MTSITVQAAVANGPYELIAAGSCIAWIAATVETIAGKRCRVTTVNYAARYTGPCNEAT